MIWNRKYNSITYDLACNKYDRCSIISRTKEVFEVDHTKTVYISELSRTYETACKLFGNKNFIKTGLLNEVPIKSFTDTKNMYPLWLWNLVGRFQWFLQNKRQPEGKKDTIIRAREMIGFLEENKEDCYMITHGFYMRTLVKELKKQGYKIKGNIFGIANLDRIFAIK